MSGHGVEEGRIMSVCPRPSRKYTAFRSQTIGPGIALKYRYAQRNPYSCRPSSRRSASDQHRPASPKPSRPMRSPRSTAEAHGRRDAGVYFNACELRGSRRRATFGPRRLAGRRRGSAGVPCGRALQNAGCELRDEPDRPARCGAGPMDGNPRNRRTTTPRSSI